MPVVSRAALVASLLLLAPAVPAMAGVVTYDITGSYHVDSTVLAEIGVASPPPAGDNVSLDFQITGDTSDTLTTNRARLVGLTHGELYVTYNGVTLDVGQLKEPSTPTIAGGNGYFFIGTDKIGLGGNKPNYGQVGFVEYNPTTKDKLVVADFYNDALGVYDGIHYRAPISVLETIPIDLSLTVGPAIVGHSGQVSDISLTLTDPVFSASATPEPATWALMGLSVGLLGGVLRRRQRQRPAAA